MASENSAARPTTGGGPADGEPDTEVPEADAAEQRAPAGDDGGSGWDAPSQESLDGADEGDVVEQAIEVAADDDERR